MLPKQQLVCRYTCGVVLKDASELALPSDGDEHPDASDYYAGKSKEPGQEWVSHMPVACGDQDSHSALER